MEPTEENVRAWNRRHGPAPPEPGIPPVVRERLPDLGGRHVLQLGCWTGEGSAELAELGALVTAVDDSADALAHARRRSDAVAWVHAELHALPHELLRGRFHLVWAERVLGRLHDVAGWARGVEAALRPGGYLLHHDDHPVAGCVDPLLRWREPYFAGPTLGHALTAVARAGLAVRRLEELPAERPRERIPGAFVLVARKPEH